MKKVSWSTNGQGWCVATVRGVFIALMRETARSWRWIGYANGHPLGQFDGLVRAKREAPKRVEELQLAAQIRIEK